MPEWISFVSFRKPTGKFSSAGGGWGGTRQLCCWHAKVRLENWSDPGSKNIYSEEGPPSNRSSVLLNRPPGTPFILLMLRKKKKKPSHNTHKVLAGLTCLLSVTVWLLLVCALITNVPVVEECTAIMANWHREHREKTTWTWRQFVIKKKRSDDMKD